MTRPTPMTAPRMGGYTLSIEKRDWDESLSSGVEREEIC